MLREHWPASPEYKGRRTLPIESLPLSGIYIHAMIAELESMFADMGGEHFELILFCA
jgi:hypothetical protein